MFYPQAQSQGSFLSEMAYTVRTSLDPAATIAGIRSAVAEVSSSATVYRASTGSAVTDVAPGRASFNSFVIGVFAIIGLILAAAGVYGVTAYSVSRRTREFGLRVALGARPTQVRGVVLKGALAIAGTGIALGGAGAIVVTTGLSELLFGVEAGDRGTYSFVAILLASTVLVAAYLPARRATRVDPTVALRSE